MKSSSCATNRLSKAFVPLLLLSTAGPSAADDEETAFGGSLGVGSDYTFRGISQTMGSPAIQASVDLSLPSGPYAYAWASNVDFIPESEPDDGAHQEIDLAIGYATDIGDDWSVDLALIRYLFPGTATDIDYDYNELIAVLRYAENYSATVAFSRNVDGTGANSLFYKLAASFDLPAEATFTVSYGHYDLSDAYGTAYSFIETSLARSIGNTAITLAYDNTHSSADLIYDARVTGPRFVLSLQIDW